MNEELQGVKNELLAAIQAAIQELRAEQKESEARVVREVTQIVHQVVHDTETRLLTAFFRWQESIDIKFQRLRADTGNATRAGELRLDNFETRLQELEKRYLMGEDESE
jgi:hypothetical protein